MWHTAWRYPCPCKLLDRELCKAAVHSQIPHAIQDDTKYSTFRGAHALPAFAYYLLALVSNVYCPKNMLAQTDDNHLRVRKRPRKPAHGTPSEITPDLNRNPSPLILLRTSKWYLLVRMLPGFGFFPPCASQKISGAIPYSFDKTVVLFLQVKDD